jgi:hypothetical protein
MRFIALAFVALAAATGTAFAHDGVEHMKGTVTQITDKAITIQVADKDKMVMTILLAPDTRFERSGKTATAKDLKVGERVVVDVVVKDKAMTAKAVKFGAATAASKPAGRQDESEHE